LRLFIGIGVSPEAREALAAAVEPLRPRVEARWVPAELYHVTLAFLGERDKHALPALEALLRETAAAAASFPLTVAELGHFGRPENAILYAAPAACPALPALSAALRTRLAEAGEAFDPKPFTPHITLARKARLPEGFTLPALTPVPFPADAVTLYHSTRIDGRLRYLPVCRAALRTQG